MLSVHVKEVWRRRNIIQGIRVEREAKLLAHKMNPSSSIRLCVWWLLVSVGQSFVSRGFVAVSEPLRPSSIERKDSASVSFLNRGRLDVGGSSSSSACSSSRVCLESDEATETKEGNSSTVNDAEEIRITESGTKILADAPEFTKPDRDLHDYRIIQLPNNLKAMLISTAAAGSSAEEKSAKVEAASVHVHAGHFDDTIAGLAHFNEQ